MNVYFFGVVDDIVNPYTYIDLTHRNCADIILCCESPQSGVFSVVSVAPYSLTAVYLLGHSW